MRHRDKTFSYTAHMYPLTPLKAELIPLAKGTDGLGNEEVDYKLSLSLFSESVEQNTLDTKTTTSARQERHKKETSSLSCLFRPWPSFLMSYLILVHLF